MQEQWVRPSIKHTREVHKLCNRCGTRPKPFPYEMGNVGLAPTWRCECRSTHKAHTTVRRGDAFSSSDVRRLGDYEERIAYAMREVLHT